VFELVIVGLVVALGPWAVRKFVSRRRLRKAPFDLATHPVPATARQTTGELDVTRTLMEAEIAQDRERRASTEKRT
jgi:hypothetical protein